MVGVEKNILYLQSEIKAQLKMFTNTYKGKLRHLYAPLLDILTWYNNYFCKVGSNYWSFICIPMGVH